MSIFLNLWGNVDGMKNDFWPSYDDSHQYNGELDGVEVILASYGGSGYEGDAFVLFREGGSLFEVHGSHCSCCGLEGQWQPEATTIESLLHRVENGKLGADDWNENHFAEELKAALKELA